ncbi:hypothetical protein DICPUDRAFT_99304 [Dictyostelium purpureum]|uniref:PB1 domain-containing protein n=1 Tax=Dictyostelium purpureum TaxID=5786 RepID=F0ZY34_DICPU|nr:uncharacterized protein DICPUDRAFT_99304 [Dictyostelium purpureum]EGC31145.1 hypothetical protein DICPUDRAFT_99304 [Dictyostelium purpureum]|eukprot:XP_003292333.1 hypothetical protein DICPUDRAFT_99304 [Dictyostelium purpureum]
MLKQTIKKWNQSIEIYENGNTQESIRILSSIDATSKINYNIGVMYIKSNNYRSAIDYFNRSIEQDKYLAASYFMRGVAHHLGGDLNHAIVDYDETVSKLRGHEYIDYKQLGLDHKLLLAEILFNKALALGRAGSSVASQAIQCQHQPTDMQIFKDQCRKIADGSQSNFHTRPIPLGLLFKPPRVSEGQSKPKQPVQAPTPTTELSTSPTSYVLKGPSVSPPAPSPSSAPPSLPPTPTREQTQNSALPPKPPSKPSFGSPSSSSSSSSSSYPSNISLYKPSPPKPPPLPSKKLPSRPISAVISEMKVTLKIFYIDRRLIQVPVPCTISTLKQKIELKFELKLDNQIEISFILDGQKELLNNQVQLDKMLCMEVNEVHLRDREYYELEQEQEQQQQQQQYVEPIKKPSLYKPPKQQFYQPSQQEETPVPKSNFVNLNKTTYPLPKTSPSQPSLSSAPPKPQYSTLRNRPPPPLGPSSPPGTSSFSTSPPPLVKPRSISQSTPPAIPARNKPSPQQPSSSSTFKTNPVSIPPRPPRPGLSQSHSPPSNNYY